MNVQRITMNNVGNPDNLKIGGTWHLTHVSRRSRLTQLQEALPKDCYDVGQQLQKNIGIKFSKSLEIHGHTPKLFRFPLKK